jgi:nucleotide-binding universal stress UspA family protein
MYDRILVGTDGSATAARAVARAVGLAGEVGATLTIMTAGRGDRAERIVTEAAAEHASSDVEIDTLVVDAQAASGLVEAADDGGYDLLVVGNKGMTGLSRFFRLGSVPNKVSHHLPCNLLIVKTT